VGQGDPRRQDQAGLGPRGDRHCINPVARANDTNTGTLKAQLSGGFKGFTGTSGTSGPNGVTTGRNCLFVTTSSR
jgi:hypothetical protein